MATRGGSVPRGAKKDGGGGRFTWGRAGELVEFEPLHPGDPLYDPELDEDYVLEQDHQDREAAIAGKVAAATGAGGAPGTGPVAEAAEGGREGESAPRITLADYKKRVEQIMLEFFDTCDLNEAYRSLVELRAPFFSYEIVKRAISMSMDRGDREKEMVSQAISAFYGNLLSMENIAKGFEALFEQIGELVKDVPDAVRLASKFTARAVADEVLPPAFLSDAAVQAKGGEVVDDAITLLSIKHNSTRLEHVWGTTDANASVEELKRAVRLCIEEWTMARDDAECASCLAGMEVPHYMHEAVMRVIALSFDKDDAARADASRLLVVLDSRGVVTAATLEQGFNRVYTRLDDLKLDTPQAPGYFDAFIAKAKADGLVGADYVPVASEEEVAGGAGVPLVSE